MALPVGMGRPRPLPPPPKPAAPKSSGGFLGNIGAAVQHASTAVQHAAVSAGTPHRTSTVSDAASSGPGYGSARANAYKQTPAYHHTVAAVFKAQPTAQKAAIVHGLTHQNLWSSPEGQAVKSVIPTLSSGEKFKLAATLKGLPDLTHNTNVGNLLAHAGADVYSQVVKPENFRAGATGKTPTPAESALVGAGKVGAGLIRRIPTGIGMPKEQRGIMEASSLGPGQLAKNAAKDLVNLPAEALPSLAIPVGEAAQGHWKQALQAVTQPYAEALKHPLQAASQHPLNTYLMFAGPGHTVARAADVAQSVARTGHAPDVRAEPVQLTGNLTHERPDLAKSPVTRVSQRSIEKQLYKRNSKGQLVPRHEDVRARLIKIEDVRARLIKIETSRLVGQNERVRVAHRTQQINAHADAVLRSAPARVAHGAKTALKYNPEPALVHGADVLARIADGTIRRPDTIEQDLRTHLAQVAANRPNLVGFPKLLKEHDAYVARLQKVLGDKSFLKHPDAAFKAAERYASEYAQIEGQAHGLGHFRDMTKQALQRRVLAHYAIMHMGARHDAELGLVRDVPVQQARAHGMTPVPAQARTEPTPLSNAAIVEHLNGPEGTGGRTPAFTSDQAKAGDGAFYVNGQRRPLPAMKGNTYFAYTHGLTEPGHESLLQQRARMQGIVDAHRSMNRLADQLLLQNERAGQPGKVKAWQSYQAAKKDAPEGYVPIRLSQAFHPQDSLAEAFKSGKVDLSTLEEEAVRRHLDVNARLEPSSEPGQWGLIDKNAAQQLRAHENLISPGNFLRGWRSVTGQFRRVALATSFRHLPGVAQEQILRAAAEGIGLVSLFAGRAVVRRAEQIDPVLGEQRHIELTGGTASGQALSLQTRQVSRHFEGTLLHGPLDAFEKLMRAPGPRQLGTAWHQWMRFTLQGTKRVLEENAQLSAVGKQAIADFGGRHGLLAAAMGNWGKMIDQAAHGILDEGQARRTGAYIRRVYGRWTDLTPGEQQALMFSPFGYWWVNSVAWLARMPIDHPLGSAFMAGLNSGTEKQRAKMGLDMFSPNHLPLYQQGGIPVGSKLWGATYYSAMGIANDPGETAASLVVPWEAELYNTLRGKNWKSETITSPANPRGRNKPSPGDVAKVFVNSLLGSFVPLYTKAQTVVEGGASSYDTSTPLQPQTKKANPGPLKGLEKAVMPVRLSAPAGQSSVSAGSSGGGWGGGSSSSSSAPGWGGGGSSTSTGGWG